MTRPMTRWDQHGPHSLCSPNGRPSLSTGNNMHEVVTRTPVNHGPAPEMRKPLNLCFSGSRRRIRGDAARARDRSRALGNSERGNRSSIRRWE